MNHRNIYLYVDPMLHEAREYLISDVQFVTIARIHIPMSTQQYIDPLAILKIQNYYTNSNPMDV